MSRIILLVGYNNYFNRKFKREPTLSDYISKSAWSYTFDSANFNINDGVYAEHTVNWPSHSTPDYLLVVEENEYIRSRWFVTEWTRTRGGQYIAKLRRDVVADCIDSIGKSPCFIERGPLKADNKLIFNSEGFNLNRIKKEEILLNETGSPWIVGYINRDAESKTISSVFNQDQYPTAESLGIRFNSAADVTSGGYVRAIDMTCIMPELRMIQRAGHSEEEVEVRFKAVMSSPNAVEDEYFYVRGQWGWNVQGRGKIPYGLNLDNAAKAFRDSLRDAGSESYRNDLYNNSVASIESLNSDLTQMENIQRIRENPIISHLGKYYRIDVTSESDQEHYEDVSSSGNFAAAYYAIEHFFQQWKTKPGVSLENEDISGVPYDLGWKEHRLELVFTEVTPPGVLKVTLSADRNHLDDAPYDMFCLEYNLSTLALAQSMAKELGQNLKDLQILPYCPARFLFGTDPLVKGRDYSPVLKNDQEAVRLYYCKHSSDTIMINKPIPIKFRDPDQAVNLKLSNECDAYRLTSPNYASSFEFSVAKNGGVDSFKVTYTYRPISPYIHVQPMFKGLYGTVNNDVRGLICGGDFSVDMLSDAFVNYQIANKNYENIFNTQIKRMDQLQGINRINAGAGIAIGTLQGATYGAAAGSMLGGGIGAAAGGIVGGAASLAGGIMDYANQEKAYGINRQYSVDMYNYTLGNIQAMPDTLTKVSAYNIDNKYFPIVEVYSCTEEEVELARSKFKYQSFAIMGIGTINELTGEQLNDKFIKGQMIRLLDFYDDEHMANEIYSEIAKGVYF